MIYVKQNQKRNKEYIFLEEFLLSDFFNNLLHGKNNLLIQEPYTGLGFPDLVCVLWDESIRKKWTKKRNHLTIIDVKILHHLYNTKIYNSFYEISLILNFSLKQIQQSIERLCNAKMLKINSKNQVKVKKLNEIFFVQEIISIEAKLRDWSRALEQSFNNTLFSSQSYILFPQKHITNNLIETYRNTNIGIITYDNSYSIIKEAKKQKIPVSLTSWLFNEYIGRHLWQKI